MEKTSSCLASLSPSLPTAYEPFREADDATSSLPDAERVTTLRAYMEWIVDRIVASPLDERLRTEHDLSDGLYRRTMYAREGTVIVGAPHKKSSLVFLQAGTISVMTERGTATMSGPLVFQAPSGSRRIGYCHTDVVWSNVFAVTGRTLDAIEEELFSLE